MSRELDSTWTTLHTHYMGLTKGHIVDTRQPHLARPLCGVTVWVWLCFKFD